MSPNPTSTNRHSELLLMLTQLTIKGLAIIESLSIDFSKHLNVITGETGAGKSILIKALSLVTGGKASSDVVRKGFDAAVVTASFHLPPSHRAFEVLSDLGLGELGTNSHEDLIVRRQISAKGRSQAWVNDFPVTQAALKNLGDALIDIFAQHENHRLLDAQLHQHYLDKFLSANEILQQYETGFDQCQMQVKEIYSLAERYQLRARERDYLSFRLSELRELAPSEEDFQELEAYCARASRAAEEGSIYDEAQQILDSGFKDKPLSYAMRELIRRFEKLKSSDSELTDLLSAARDVESQLNDLSYGLGKLASELEYDDSQLEQYQERLGSYKDLCRKLGVVDVGALTQEMKRLEDEIGFLESAETEMVERLTKLLKDSGKLFAQAKTLSHERRQAFQQVRGKIHQELEQLDMKGAMLEAEFAIVQQSLPALDLGAFGARANDLWISIVDQLSQLNRQGIERIQFLLAANPGEPARPLGKVASGGELSRIMLGIKKILSVGADTCVMVFDEIDTGISGKTANIVGAKLRDISREFQVICISHLAQVAAFGDAHFKVEKAVSEGRTESRIFLLGERQSTEEIARLLSGDEITAPSLAHAKQLIDKAQQRSGTRGKNQKRRASSNPLSQSY